MGIYRRLLDAASETAKGKAKIGSTLKGIGPTYMDKTGRNGIRVGDIEFEDFKEAFSAMTRIAFEAEKLQHHPEWSNIYNSLEIFLFTHDAEGVTEKDFELAKTIDNLIG